MISNFVEIRKGFRRISVTRDNTVKITVNRGKTIDEPESTITKVTKKYQIVTSVTVGRETFIQCLGKTSMDVYSVSHCEKICEADKNSKIGFMSAAGEVFVKVEEGENQKVYD